MPLFDLLANLFAYLFLSSKFPLLLPQSQFVQSRFPILSLHLQSFHQTFTNFGLARRLGQLVPVKVLLMDNARTLSLFIGVTKQRNFSVDHAELDFQLLQLLHIFECALAIFFRQLIHLSLVVLFRHYAQVMLFLEPVL